MSLSALFHQVPPQMRTRYAQLDSASRAPRNTLPAFLATAAKTSILVKFIRGRLGLSRAEGIGLMA